jgi:predicted RNase H-like nuclease (RuvC/YqgF family)
MIFFIGQLSKLLNDLMWKVKKEKYDKPKAKELKKCRQTVKNQENRITKLEEKVETVMEQRNEVIQEARHWRTSFHNCSSELATIVKSHSVIEDVDFAYPNYPEAVE